jgi:hypothetical protein
MVTTPTTFLESFFSSTQTRCESSFIMMSIIDFRLASGVLTGGLHDVGRFYKRQFISLYSFFFNIKLTAKYSLQGKLS